MKIAEIYSSKQGEGLLTGTPSVFVRTSGCNLRCQFCDTPFTSWEPEGTLRSVDWIAEQVENFTDQHVVITGGEPMLPGEIVSLTRRIHDLQRHITIETAGTILRDVQCDLMSISPKLSNSTPSVERGGDWSRRHEQSRINVPVLRSLVGGWNFQLKFVMADPADLEEICQLLDQLPDVPRDRVLLMPEGIDSAALAQRMLWLEPLALRHGFRTCPRKHIEWYGNRRGT